MRVLTADEMREAEQNAFDMGLTGAGLMKTAGEKCAGAIIKHFSLPKMYNDVCVVCGSGRNAGDGFVIAKLLRYSGCKVNIVLAKEEPDIDECKLYFNDAVNAGIPFSFWKDVGDDNIKSASLIVECLFGFGFHGEAKAPYDEIMDAINASEAKVACIDVPAGTNATDGSACKNAVRGDFTVAISCLKFSHVLPPSNALCGKIKVVDIGIDKKCFSKGRYVHTITEKSIKANFPKRDKNANKGTFGRLLSLCGSHQMPGAAIICAAAAVSSGAGLVKCAYPRSAYAPIASNVIGATHLPLDEENGVLSESSIPAILEEMKRSDAVVAGCGLGSGRGVEAAVRSILENAQIPVVLDADGINCVTSSISILRECKAPVIITPHPGEMARLLKLDVAFVQSRRLQLSRETALALGAIIVLKGANTIVTDGNKTYICTHGNPGMAKGGTGDMLAGMIGAFAAQGMEPFEAAKSAVLIHSVCGDLCARELSQRGMTASHMLEMLPALLNEYEN